MESFRNYKESTDTILDRLNAKDYLIGNSEINDVIDELYALVDVNENYIDEAIMAIEKLCDNNPMFKAEWEGALDEVEDEVLEESKLGKLASIALLAISMGITLTGCEASPNVQLETPAPTLDVKGDNGGHDRIGDNAKEETKVNEQKPTYEEAKGKYEFKREYSSGREEIFSLTDKEWNDIVELPGNMVIGGELRSIARPIPNKLNEVYNSLKPYEGSDPNHPEEELPRFLYYREMGTDEWKNFKYNSFPWEYEIID